MFDIVRIGALQQGHLGKVLASATRPRGAADPARATHPQLNRDGAPTPHRDILGQGEMSVYQEAILVAERT
jgi:hypothetical protein